MSVPPSRHIRVFGAALRLVAVAIGALVLLGLPCAARAQTDIIRGRVTGPDSQPVPNVTVTATSMSGNVTRGTKTDRNGRFTITFPGGEGDYIVSFAALGFAPRRFELKRSADEEILVADAALQAYAQRLDTMHVTGKRNKVSRNDNSPDIGGTEHGVNSGALPIDQATDLAALAASLPGVQLIPGSDGSSNGFSVLGLGADQNDMTLNGLNFSGSDIPRDAQVVTTLVTSPYDVSRGGFSGGQLTLRTRPGSNFEVRSLSTTLAQPSLQFTDPAGRALGQRYSNYTLSGLLAGPLVYDKAFYNFAYQLGRRANDLQTPLNTDPLGLRTAGIASDSVQRLLGILTQEAIPATIGGIPNERITDQGSLFGTLDFNPPFSTSGQTFNVTASGGWNRTNPISGSTTELPAHSGDRTNWNGSVQGRHSAYVASVLTETTLGVSASRNYGTPYLQLPSGTVLVSSVFPDGSPALESLLFGGNASLGTSARSSSESVLNALSWFSEDNKHRLKLQTELRRDDFGQDQTTNRLGTFTFNSLADLQAGRPASFTRQLSPRRVNGSQLVGAVSLGDALRKSADLQLTYGVRLDANRFLYDPALNPDVERLFGTRNDHAPDRLYVSPRIGFSWQYGKEAQISAFQGAFRGPRAVVRGGIGIFQSTPGATLLSGAVYNTGLPGSLQQLYCVGPAAPVPDWSVYAQDPGTIPTTCADGTTGTVFANSAPNVTLFDPGFAAPRSLRSNLNWQGTVLDNRFTMSVDAQYSLNVDQQGFVDLNFRPTTQFTLPDESGRPVFVSPSSIVPATGAIAPGDGRVTPSYSHVTEIRSDLRSASRQLMVSLSPFSFNSRLSWSLSYVYLNVRDMVHGFSSTGGNPLDRTWGRAGMDFRHQFQYSLFYNAFDAVRISWFGRVSAGTPFTPMIAGDVNGDGYSNDRAFIFDPAATRDTALASAMRELLDHSRGRVHDCLLKQLGTIAARNSCQGPWTHTATMTLSFNSLKLRLPQRATLSLQVSNPLGAADLLLHGENRLHGWGQVSIPDQSLLHVRGFDPDSGGRYVYQVNQRFGATNPAFTTFRAPVTLTAMLRFDVGPTRERQMLGMQLDRGRRAQGQRLPEQALMMMLSQGLLPNPLANILRSADTLQLTQPQADSIAMLNRYYTIRLDSIWAPVAKYLASLPERYDGDAAYDRYKHAREQSVDVLLRIVPDVRSLLTKEQYRKLPSLVSTYLDARYLASIRSGTAGSGGMAFFPLMGGAPAMGSGPVQIFIRQ